jgi:hypothetical protein
MAVAQVTRVDPNALSSLPANALRSTRSTRFHRLQSADLLRHGNPATMPRIARLSALPPTRYFTALRRTSCAPANLVLRSLFARHVCGPRLPYHLHAPQFLTCPR